MSKHTKFIYFFTFFKNIFFDHSSWCYRI